MPRRSGTKTRSFGAGSRENHDAGAYYARQLMPVGVNADAGLDPEPRHENPLPKSVRNQFFRKSSENMDELPDRCVHLMVTSPPYNVGKEYDADLSMEQYLGLIENVMRETHRVLVDGGRACVNVANIGRKPYIPLHAYVIQIAAEIGFFMRGEIIWDKGMSGSSTAWGSWMSPSNPTLRDTHEYILVFQKPPFGRKCQDDREATITRDDFLEHTKSTWSFAPASAKHAKHPAPFPVELPRRLTDLYTFSGEVVLDPFMGTGATALAAVESGRVFVGYEISSEYVEAASKRVNAYSTDTR
jgi:site-specific DNA-methyltransferase (adenine-specific)